MGKVVIGAGGAHRVEAPIDGSSGIAIFPKSGVTYVASKGILGAEASTNTGLLLDHIQFTHAETP
jgi:hypothetical protein